MGGQSNPLRSTATRGEGRAAAPASGNPASGNPRARAANARPRPGGAQPRLPAPDPRRQARVAGAIAFAALAALTGTGFALGKGIGVTVNAVRGHEVQWVAQKVAEPDPLDTDGPAIACLASSLEVTLTAPDEGVAPGRTTNFDVTIVNTGRRPCLIDAGDSNVGLVATDRDGGIFWTSSHCPASGNREVMIGPGDEVHHTFGWAGTTSRSGNCRSGLVPKGSVDLQAFLPQIAAARSNVLHLAVKAAVAVPSAAPTTSTAPTPTETAPEPAASAAVDSAEPAEGAADVAEAVAAGEVGGGGDVDATDEAPAGVEDATEPTAPALVPTGETTDAANVTPTAEAGPTDQAEDAADEG